MDFPPYVDARMHREMMPRFIRDRIERPTLPIWIAPGVHITIREGRWEIHVHSPELRLCLPLSELGMDRMAEAWLMSRTSPAGSQALLGRGCPEFGQY